MWTQIKRNKNTPAGQRVQDPVVLEAEDPALQTLIPSNKKI